MARRFDVSERGKKVNVEVDINGVKKTIKGMSKAVYNQLQGGKIKVIKEPVAEPEEIKKPEKEETKEAKQEVKEATQEAKEKKTTEKPKK